MTRYERYVAACQSQGKPPISEAAYEAARKAAIQKSNEQTLRSNEACRKATHADIYGGDLP